MTVVNPQIRRWLGQGRAKEAILGIGNYYVRSSLYVGDHDLILVMNQLFTWAADEKRSEDASRALEAAVSEAAERGEVGKAYDILRCYFLISDDRRTALPVSAERLIGSLDSLDPPVAVPTELMEGVLARVRQLTEAS